MLEWKPVVGYEDSYLVSNEGDVKSLPKKTRKFTVILKQKTTKFGYKNVKLSKDGKCKDFFVHRLVAEAFCSNNKNKPFVNHIDGDKTNNNYINLEWCTASENVLHAFKTGLKTITEKQKLALSERWLGGKHTTESIAKMSKAQQGSKNSFYGKTHSKETKKKLSKAHKGKVGKKSPNFKGIYYTPFGVFESSRLAARAIGCDKKTITNRCESDKFPDYYFVEKSLC